MMRVHRFEKTGIVENRAKCNRKKGMFVVCCIQIKASASESAAGTSSAMKLTGAWVYEHPRSICHGILDLFSYK